MISKLPALSLIGLASLQTVCSQFTTATVFPDGDITNVKGQIKGSGTDGTTYVLSGVFSSSGSAETVTVTLVEDATHFSEMVAISTESATVNIIENCNYNAQLQGVCTMIQEVVVPSLTVDTTLTGSGVISLDPVVLATAKSAASRSRGVHFLIAVPFLSLGLVIISFA
ncbi:hypothetical protein M0805_007232 [Coniferiporia weirii]|nr:hypothetical protein M0805_007232 [Coniferiporia weirii]